MPCLSQNYKVVYILNGDRLSVQKIFDSLDEYLAGKEITSIHKQRDGFKRVMRSSCEIFYTMNSVSMTLFKPVEDCIIVQTDTYIDKGNFGKLHGDRILVELHYRILNLAKQNGFSYVTNCKQGAPCSHLFTKEYNSAYNAV